MAGLAISSIVWLGPWARANFGGNVGTHKYRVSFAMV